MIASDRIAPPAPPKGGGNGGAKRREGPGFARRFAEVFAVVAIIAAMGAWYMLTQPTDRDTPRRPAVAVEESEKKPSEELIAASKIAEQKAAAEERARRDERRAREQAEHEAELAKARAAAEFERKERLLREATADLAADRLTTPSDQNAFSRYRAVLTLDPANEAALTGLHDILTRYLVLAKAAANENNFDLAKSYLNKAGAVSPGAESIAAARVALDKRKQANEEEGGGRRTQTHGSGPPCYRAGAQAPGSRPARGGRGTAPHQVRARSRNRAQTRRTGSRRSGEARSGLQEGTGDRRPARVRRRGIRRGSSHVAAG
jgi:hypothetical protein